MSSWSWAAMPMPVSLTEISVAPSARTALIATRRHDVLKILFLFGVEFAEHPLEEDLREADDRVERGPQLVRHIRQELRLVAARSLELLVEPSQLLAHPVEVRREGAELVAVRDLDATSEVA